MVVLTPAHGLMGRPRKHVNRKESGSGAGPYRPCLRRESQAITHGEIPCQASNSLLQAKAKAQLPLPGTARGARGDAGRRGGGTSCFPAPRQQSSRTGTREEQALPACTSTGTDTGSQRDGKQARPAQWGSAGTGSSPDFQGTSAQHGAEQAGSKLVRGLGPWKQESCYHNLAPKRTNPGAAQRCRSCPRSREGKAAGSWQGLLAQLCSAPTAWAPAGARLT